MRSADSHCLIVSPVKLFLRAKRANRIRGMRPTFVIFVSFVVNRRCNAQRWPRNRPRARYHGKMGEGPLPPL
jgi:hypothetical protein